MDIEKIRALASIMSEHSLSKIKIDEEDSHILLEASNTVLQTSAAPLQLNTPSKVCETTQAPSKPESNCYEQKSSLVGTVYLAPDSKSSPFVSVGSKVKKGDIICIIESMKMLNDIAADTDGIIAEVCVNNEQLVEYDQTLFLIKTN